MIPGWAGPVGFPADFTLFSLGARLCRLFLGVRFSAGSGVGGAVVMTGDPVVVGGAGLGRVDSFDSSLTGEGGLDRSSTVFDSKTLSSDLSGTISGGWAVLLGRLPARLVLVMTGEVGIGMAVISDATERRSFAPGAFDPSRLAANVLAILALDLRL